MHGGCPVYLLLTWFDCDIPAYNHGIPGYDRSGEVWVPAVLAKFVVAPIMALTLLRRPLGACMHAGRRTLASKAPAGASSTALPVLVHGKRSIKAGMVEEFHRHYGAYAKAMFERPGIKAVYAFADKEDPLSYWHVTFASDTASFDAARARVAQADASVRLASIYKLANLT